MKSRPVEDAPAVQVPNVTVAEINIELEFQMTFVLEWDASAGTWGPPQKAKMEMLHLDRTVRGNSVPLPRTLLRCAPNLKNRLKNCNLKRDEC